MYIVSSMIFMQFITWVRVQKHTDVVFTLIVLMLFVLLFLLVVTLVVFCKHIIWNDTAKIPLTFPLLISQAKAVFCLVQSAAGKFATEDKISHGTLAYARSYKLLKTTSKKTGVNDVLICKLKVEAKTKHSLLKPLTMLTAIKYTIFSHD